jgi:hypothetical protein
VPRPTPRIIEASEDFDSIPGESDFFFRLTKRGLRPGFPLFESPPRKRHLSRMPSK